MQLALTYLLMSLGALSYAGASALFFLQVARKDGRAPRASRPDEGEATRPSHLREAAPALAPRLLAVSSLLHLAYITSASFVTHTCPVGSVHFVLSLVAITTGFGFTLARARATGPRENIDALGLLVGPLGLAFLLGTFFLDKPAVSSSIGTVFLALHVLANVIGVALFFLAGAAAVLYLVQERRLKQKKLARIGGLPPLDTLDRAVHRFLVSGFPLLTVGILSGTFWAYQLESGSTDEIMRIVFGYATWLLIALVLLLRVVAGWRGKRSAYGTLLGLTFAMGVIGVYALRTTTPGEAKQTRLTEPVHTVPVHRGGSR